MKEAIKEGDLERRGEVGDNEKKTKYCQDDYYASQTYTNKI